MLSSSKCRAAISKAARFILFEASKLRILSTTSPPKCTSKALGVVCWNHAWCIAASGVIRSFGFLVMRAVMSSLASSLTLSQDSPSNLHLPSRTLARVSRVLGPMIGARPLNKTKRITPALQTSHILSYLPTTTWGAMYMAVPTFDFNNLPGSLGQAQPKSMSFKVFPGMGSLVAKRKFSGFKSRCAMSWLCMYQTARRICSMTMLAVASEKCCASTMRSKSSPPPANSITMYVAFRSTKVSNNLMMFGWSIAFMIAISSLKASVDVVLPLLIILTARTSSVTLCFAKLTLP
mmetsp:Transcript_57394/g.166667  ORF Transcript_57394/g.166667 Transcript_57394/m.166667 type:complete len:292 (+) Transcript_57394:722-1597(+)